MRSPLSPTEQARQADRVMAYGLSRLRQLGLTGWTFAWASTDSYFGRVDHARRIIVLSHPWALARPEGLSKITVLHELAHCIAGESAGHGPAWVLTARRLGLAGNRHSPAGPYRPEKLQINH